MLWKVRRAAVAVCATAAICGVDDGANAQATDGTEGGGVTAQLTVSPQVAYSDRDDEGLSARTGLRFLLSDVGKAQALTFEATGGLLQSLTGDSSRSFFDQPRLRAGYLYETRETSIGFDATYSRADLDTSFVDPLGGFLIVDDGTRTDLSLGTNVEFGRESPFGGTFTARRAYRQFDDTTDQRFQDAVIDAAGLSLIFRVTPRVAITTSGDFQNVEADGPGTDREDRRARIGASFIVDPTLTADAGVTYEQNRRSGPLVDDRDESGLGFDLGVTQSRPNGTLTGRLSSGIGDNGRRTRIDLERSLDLRDGSLAFGVGVARSQDGGGIDPLFSLAYVKETPQGELTAALRQSYVSNIDGEETISTTLSLGYARQIGPLDQIRASYVLQDSSVQSGDEADARRSELGLTYSRDVTRDWALVAGYTYERDESDNSDTEVDNEIFLGLQRTFTWRN